MYRTKTTIEHKVICMNFLQQSSKAQDRPLGSWYVQIQSGALKLPRFQRFESWDRARITGFLNTVIQNLPVGVTLLLQVGDKEQFVSRYIATAPEIGSRVVEHLLDGQQRLTAFWRAVHNNYTDETYFVYLPEFDDRSDAGGKDDELAVYCQPRWMGAKEPTQRYPVWANAPSRCLERGLVPIDLLRPGDHGTFVEKWISDATVALEPAEDTPDALRLFKLLEKRRQQLRAILRDLRDRVTHFNLPFLSLPVTTSADVALQVESVANASLHALQEKSEASHVELTYFGDLSWTLLTTSALMQNKMPNKSGVSTMDMARMVGDWSTLERASVRTINFLARQHIFDEARLPSAPVLAVIAACFAKIPEHGDEPGRAEQLLRAYTWSSFFTSRYESAAATRAYQDFKSLTELLARPQFSSEDYPLVPVLRRTDYPLPTTEQLIRVGWPKGADRLARAVLGISVYFGALDFADGHSASYESLRRREYHHVFPDALLQEAKIDSYLALNCALVTWKTNRSIGRKDPLAYLRDRVEWSDEETVRHRLRTHLLDFDALSKATYEMDSVALQGDELAASLRRDFESFLNGRAKLVAAAAETLAAGNLLLLDQLHAKVDSRDEEAV
jgi:hypothetical protein